MRSFIISFLLLFGLVKGLTQPGTNIIPNPSFEEYSSYPIGWFYTGKHFSSVIKYWSSPTAASPDVFGPKIHVPQLWKDKGFGLANAKEGASMAGITLFGCHEGKPHCREYIQTPLMEPMVIGQTYELAMWVRRLNGSYANHTLAVHWQEGRTYVDDDILLELNPRASFDVPKNHLKDDWIWVKTTFTARSEADYIIIGNFNRDLDSKVVIPENNKLNYSYYYIDDVALRKTAPFVPTPERKATWEGKELKPPATFRLANIFFDTDKSILLPRSFEELNKLVALLQTYPKMTIRIDGHTDSQGGEKYNDDLSIRRAIAVEKYLKENNVDPKRLSVSGHGRHRPVSSNETADGRQLNRRVEFTILTI